MCPRWRQSQATQADNREEKLRGKACASQDLTSPRPTKKWLEIKGMALARNLRHARIRGKWESREKVTENITCKEEDGAESRILEPEGRENTKIMSFKNKTPL